MMKTWIVALIGCLLSSAAMAQSGTAKTATALNNEIASSLASGQTPPISASTLRQVVLDMVATTYAPQGTVASTTGFSSPGFSVDGSGNVIAGPLTTIGTSLYPTTQGAIGSTANVTSGNATFTVSGVSGGTIAVGMDIYTDLSIFPTGTYVTGVSGSSITASVAAAGSNASLSVQFGITRYNATSALIANSIGSKNLYVGTASQSNSTWPTQHYGLYGADNGGIVMMSIGNVGPAGVFAVKTSENTTGLPYGIMILGVMDNPTSGQNIWSMYIQGEVPAGALAATSQLFNQENSIYNKNTIITTLDPFNTNVTGATHNLRLDCGTGQSGPLRCASALDIVNNGNSYSNPAIIIGDTALDTSLDTHPAALAMPNAYSVSWYTSAGVLGTRLYGGDGQLNIVDTWITVGTTYTALKLNVTNTASAAASLLMDLQVGGSSKFKVDKSGDVGIGLGSASPAQPLEIGMPGNFQMRLGDGGVTTNFDIGRSTVTGFLSFYGNQSGATGYVFGGADGTYLTITDAGHLMVGSTTAPAPSACGTGTVVGTDQAGTATLTGTTGCTLTFHNTFTTAPHCVVSNRTTRAGMTYTVSATAIVVAGATAADVLDYDCMGVNGGT